MPEPIDYIIYETIRPQNMCTTSSIPSDNSFPPLHRNISPMPEAPVPVPEVPVPDPNPDCIPGLMIRLKSFCLFPGHGESAYVAKLVKCLGRIGRSDENWWKISISDMPGSPYFFPFDMNKRDRYELY